MTTSKKRNNGSNQYLKSNVSILDCERRPVTLADKWCQHKSPSKDWEPVGNAPWGYVVTIPYLPNKNTYLSDVQGYIVSAKKHCGKLLLQVIEKDYAPQYGVKSFPRDARLSKTKRKKNRKFFRILNIRNFAKSENKW